MDENQTNSELIRLFLETMQSRRYKTSTLKSYKLHLGHFEKELELHSLHALEISPATLDTIIAEWDAINLNTYNNRISTIKKFYSFLQTRDLVLRNPVITDMFARSPRPSLSVLTDRDVETILLYADQKGLNASVAIRLMLYAGLRVSELNAIPIQSIEYFNNGITMLISSPKFDKSRLTVVTDKTTITLLDRYLKESHFLGKNLLFFSASYIRKIFDNAVPYLSFSATPHDARRYYATSIAKQGVPVPLISKLLGHENIQTTQRYIHIRDMDIREYFSLS